jgi:hypothetical protein
VTAANSLHRRFGRLELPLAQSRAASLAALDPAQTILLDLFSAALNAELATVWRAAVAGTALELAATPVVTKLPAVPDAAKLQQMKAEFPLLCVARSASRPATGDQLSIDLPRLTQLWDIDYLLCPLTAGNEIRLTPILQAVDKIIRSVVEEGGHMAYATRSNDGFTYAEGVLGDDGDTTCGFFSCSVQESAFGPARISRDGPSFQACGLTLRTEEISRYREADGVSVPFLGTTGTFGITESGDPAIVGVTPPPLT